MDFRRLNPYSLIVLTCIFSALFCISIADSQNQFRAGRYLDEATRTSGKLILAANRTHRRDPSDGFKFYNGGWNITNEHYLYSVAFSAGPLVIVAAVWLVVFGICLLCMCFRRCCCCREKHNSYSRAIYAIALTFLILLAIAAIWGSYYIYCGQGKFENSIVDVVSYVLKKADTVATNLSEVVNYLASAKKIGIGQMLLPPELLGKIDEVQGQVNNFTGDMRKVTSKNSDDVRKFTDPMRTTLFCVATFMLVLVILGLLLSVLGLSCIVYMINMYIMVWNRGGIIRVLQFIICDWIMYLTIVGWLAVVVTLLMSGVFLFVHNAASDTCVAMDEWLQNPTVESALERIIPKVDDKVAQDIFQSTKGVTAGLVNMTNMAITTLYNADSTPDFPLYAHRSGPPMPLLCNPFNADLTDRKCGKDEVELDKASEVWKGYMCQSSRSGICITQGRVTLDDYKDLTASANVSYGLYRYGPFLVNLVDSTYIKETFSEIRKNNCPSLLKQSQFMHIGFTIISVSVMCSLILWVVFGREQRHRKSTKKMMASPHNREFIAMKPV